MRSAVERVELREMRVERRILAVLRAVVVCVRRAVMVVSMTPSCSGVRVVSVF